MSKRIKAGIIDLLLTSVIHAVLMYLFLIKLLADKHIDSSQVMLINLRLTIISITYMIIRDVLGSRSIGKRILNLNIVNCSDGKKSKFLLRLVRNLTWVLGPTEVIIFLITGKRLGDKISGTTVN